MKPTCFRYDKQLALRWISLLSCGVAAAASAGTDTNAPAKAPPPLTPEQNFEGGAKTYNNWVEFSTGGIISTGNKSNFQQQHQFSGPAFGGIEGLHYGTNLNKNTTFTLDARAIADEHDYKLKLAVDRENGPYLHLSYRQYRTWTDGDGGYFSPADANFPLANNGLGLDRGSLTLETGVKRETGLNIAVKYTHNFREGEEASTSWGDTHPDFTSTTRGLSPSYQAIHEHSDSVQVDLTDKIKSTYLGLGGRVEYGHLSDSLNITEYPNEPVQQKITSQQGTTYDLGEVHGFTETWFKPNLVFSSGFSYSHLENTFFGSRITGSGFDVGYVPTSGAGFGYTNLSGTSRLNEAVMDLNLLYRPTPNLTITPSFRLQKEASDETASGIETLSDFSTTPFNANGATGNLDARERLDVSYKGLTNWVLHSTMDFTEVTGSLDQYGGLVPISGIGLSPVASGIDGQNFVQKYAAGARWYPTRRITLDAGGYYKLDRYRYDYSTDSAPNNSPVRYPGYLALQRFATYDGNLRLTVRPLQNLTLSSRYEYQWSTIHTMPDGLSGLSEVESAQMRTHILAQDATWVPWSRLSLQAGFSYVLSDTHTPASDVTQAILDARNNYWTVNFTSGLVLNDKTDLDVSYFYYQADDFSDIALSGVPYGAGAQEHAVTATLTRRISEKIRLSLKYGYFRFLDAPSAGNADYGVHLIYATMRYRF